VDRDSLKELIDAPEEALSTLRSNNEIMEARYTFSQNIATNFYHADIMREKLPRHMGELVPHIVDETRAALEDELSACDGFSLLISH
jgi:hypothetical protein